MSSFNIYVWEINWLTHLMKKNFFNQILFNKKQLFFYLLINI